MEQTKQKLRELLAIQGTDGNWNYDPYMLGLYNGLELALATLEERDPLYKDSPKEWIADKPLTGVLEVVGTI